MNLITYAVGEISNLKVLGRTSKNREPLTLFWTGSGIEGNIKASELWIEVEADYEIHEPWISIVIDGAYVSRRMLDKGRQWICLFRNMNPEIIKNVKVLKDVQAMPCDDRHCLQIHSLKTDGSFESVKEYDYKIEFIGDSITSGEGSIGAKKEEDWISMWFSTQNNYAIMTANALNADYHIISQSGWGVLTGWDNNPHSALPLYYEKVCGLLNGEKNKSFGAFEENDFDAWQPHAVVINLGTNDGSAFNAIEWQDESSGETYKQHLNADGSYNMEDIKRFKAAIIAFLYKIRKYNKEAHVLWVYGMLGNFMLEHIEDAINTYKKEAKDQKVELIELPNTTEATVGARQHPGVLAHQAASKVIAKRLQELFD